MVGEARWQDIVNCQRRTNTLLEHTYPVSSHRKVGKFVTFPAHISPGKDEMETDESVDDPVRK